MYYNVTLNQDKQLILTFENLKKQRKQLINFQISCLLFN